MLQLALTSEKSAIAQCNAAAEECHTLGYHGIASLLEDTVLDGEKHADLFESQLEAIERIGVQRYLAQQVPLARVQGTTDVPPSSPAPILDPRR